MTRRGSRRATTAMSKASAWSTSAACRSATTARKCAARTCSPQAAAARSSEAAPFAIRFHLAPGVEPTVTADGMGAILRSPGAPAWNFRCRGAMIVVEDSLVDRRRGAHRADAAAGRRRRSIGRRRRHRLAVPPLQLIEEGRFHDLDRAHPPRPAVRVRQDRARPLAAGARRATASSWSRPAAPRRRCATLGHEVRDVSDLTGFPEMMDGRVKTLHPKVHGGLLAVRDDADACRGDGRAWHRRDRPRRRQPLPVRADRGARAPTATRIIENIDIGGPSMVRSAAKNHAFVAIVTDPGRLCRADRGARRERRHRRSTCAASSPPRPLPPPRPMTSTIVDWFAFADQGETLPRRAARCRRR